MYLLPSEVIKLLRSFGLACKPIQQRVCVKICALATTAATFIYIIYILNILFFKQPIYFIILTRIYFHTCEYAIKLCTYSAYMLVIIESICWLSAAISLLTTGCQQPWPFKICPAASGELF